MMADESHKEYVYRLQTENTYLSAVAHGLDGMLAEAKGLLKLCSDFMQSVEYDSAIDASQCCGILKQVKDFLEDY